MSRPVVNPGRVDWTGENPGIYLKEDGAEDFASLASFFRVARSPFGYGHAAFVFPSPRTAGAPNACYTDNPPLAAWLARDFLAHFGAFKNLPALDAPVIVSPASFSFDASSPRRWSEVIRADDTEVRLDWIGLGNPFMVELPFDQSATGKHDMFSLFVPAESAEIVVDGARLPGRAVPRQMGDRPFSSAFLALSE
ncbi:MAG: hypothetical protein ACREOS_11005, partial [Candidatus Dormibacteraceae bacterium]